MAGSGTFRSKVPPPDFYTPKQPANKEAMITGLEKLRHMMREIGQKYRALQKFPRQALQPPVR